MSTKTARRAKYGTETLLVGTQLNEIYFSCGWFLLSPKIACSNKMNGMKKLNNNNRVLKFYLR